MSSRQGRRRRPQPGGDPYRDAPGDTPPRHDGVLVLPSGPPTGTLWSQRLLRDVELATDPVRFDRGVRYARAGMVDRLEVSPGMVYAEVEGSRRRAYEVGLESGAPDDHAWDAAVPLLAAWPAVARRLLAGELPPEAGEILASTGIDLLPAEDLDDPAWWCTCPDWEVSCKHVVAVWHAFAARVDADPLVLLDWRGCDRERLLDRLRALLAMLPADEEGGSTALGDQPNGPRAGDPVDVATFWGATPSGSGGPPVPGEPVPAGTPDALLRRLAPTPLGVRGHPLAELLCPAYERIAAYAARLGEH